MVYGYCLNKTKETEVVMTSFKMALSTLKKLIKHIPETIFHQDQGSQYTSYEYVDAVLKKGHILSYSTPGTPTENPGQESFFGRFKDECRDEMMEIETFEQLEKMIDKRMKYYNNKRLHTSLELRSPKDFTLDFAKNFHIKNTK